MPAPIPRTRRLSLAALALAAACGGSHRPSGAAPSAAAPGALPPLPHLSAGGAYQAVAPRSDVPDPRPARDRSARATLVAYQGSEPPVAFALSHTRVSVRVVGNVARVEMVQRFDNPTDRRLEAVYAFPLPENAAVTDMTFQIGRRVVTSEVQRREEARATYQAARREGRTAALTEQERPNLFTQSVANIPPGESVFVAVRYVHEVPFQDGRYLLAVPTTIGPRYVPGEPTARSGGGLSDDTDQVADGSRVTPPVAPGEAHFTPDLELAVQLLPGDAFQDVAARSHRVVTGLDGSGARLVGLAEDDRAPDRDFVLAWRPAGAEPEARALVERERDDDYLLLLVQPPSDVDAAVVRPRELVFLIDKSGSMSGRPLETVRALVVRALRGLRPQDTFQLVAFDVGTEAMTPGPLPADADSVARAEAWLQTLQGGGGTEMLPGFRAALRAPHDPSRLRLLVFLTDGFIGNEPAVIEAVAQERGDARVFGFGIGTSVNRYLVEGVARAGRGTAEVVAPDDPIDDAVARLLARLDRPVLTDLEVAFEGGAVTDLTPAQLPDLFAGRPLVVSGRLRGAAPTAAVLRGALGGSTWTRRVAITHSPATAGSPGAVAGTLWARRRIDELTSRRPTAPSSDEVAEVVALGLRFKLVTAYTSFVAVERELLVDPRLALATVLVPNELPAGVSREGIFGPARLQVLPGRVKPGDPELWISAAQSARSVRLKLPFEPAWRDAVPDGEGWTARFLVPPGQPDGSYDAQVVIRHADGREEHRTAPIRVDTSAPALAVVAAPRSVAPGEVLRLRLRPALPLSRLPALLHRPGGLLDAVKGEIETKEILVRAPWGAVGRAHPAGVLGTWLVELPVPASATVGEGTIEVVSSDAAGNVRRLALPLSVLAPAPPAAPPAGESFPYRPSLLAAALLLAALVAGMAVVLAVPRPRRPRAVQVLAGVPLPDDRSMPA